MARAWSMAGAALLAILLASWAVTPSAPLAADAPPALFSAGRAMADVRAIGRRPHVIGSGADREVALYLAHRMAGMGLAVGVQPVPIDAKARAKLSGWTEQPVPADLRGISLIGLLPGRDRAAPAVLLMAHHDTVWGSPGAADDSMGVATILETVRALRTGPPPQRDVIVLLTDGEEVGLSGAKAFFAEPALRDHIGAVLNFETRGAGGRVMMFETGTGNGAMMRTFGHAVPWPSATSLSVLVYRMLPNSTDLTAALKQNLFGFNFAIGGRAGLYHSPLATPERIDPASLQDMGQQALALTGALARADRLPARTPDRAFADLWGSRLIDYPLWGGWLLLLASGGLAGFAVARLRDRVSARAVAKGLVVPLALVVGTGVALFLINRLSGAGAGSNYYDRLAALPRLETQAALVCAGVLLLVAAWRGASLWGGWIALLAVWGGLGVAAQIVAPGVGPFVQWPLLVAAAEMAVAAWLMPERGAEAAIERPHILAPIALLAAAAAGQTLGFGHQIFLMLGAPTPEAMVAVTLPVALLCWPLLHRLIAWRATRAIVAVALVAAVALALWVRLDPIAPSAAVYSVDKR